MSNQRFLPLFRALFAAGFLLNFVARCATAAEVAEDPAQRLLSTQVVEDSAEVKASFEKLKSDDFDQREHAMQKLAASGPGILKLIDRYLKSDVPQQATLAGLLRLRVLLGYDGYFQTDPNVSARMEQKVRVDFSRPISEGLAQVAKALECKLVHDPAYREPELLLQAEPANRVEQPVRTLLELFAAYGVPTIVRGDTMFVTVPANAEKVSQQRHVFDWSELRLNRDEAQRVGDGLRLFLPHNCELNAAPETFTVRGPEAAIVRAARLVEAMKPAEGAVQWPKATLDLGAVIEKVERNASLALNGEDPVNAIEILRKAGHDIYAVGFDASKALDQLPYPDELRAAAPARLRLADLPLGCVLRWLERRTRFATADLSGFVLGFELSNEGRIQMQVRKGERNPLEQSMLAADVGFLYAKNARPNAAVDAEVKQKIFAALEPHLQLFPTFDESTELVVLRGRMFVRGSGPLLLSIERLLKDWRAKGQPPAMPAWRAKLDEKLDATHDWSGRGMTGGKLLPTLRGLGKINLLLEDGPDGTAASFELTAQDARLLPDGPQTLRALLTALAEKANANWSVEQGVIVVRPKKRVTAP